MTCECKLVTTISPMKTPHQSLGYWNDAEQTAERFKPVPNQQTGLVMPEIAVWSGDTVRVDEEGFTYFISRSLNTVLVTKNVREFCKLKELKVENWSA